MGLRRHCERSDDAIQLGREPTRTALQRRWGLRQVSIRRWLDCFAALAM